MGDLFDHHGHAKIRNFIEETEKNLNLTMNSQAEMTGTLKNLKIWMKAQTTSLTKNANELKNYLHQQEKLENNTTYVTPPPKHVDSSQEFIKTHKEWNNTGYFVIMNS